MARVICSRPNAAEEISGVKFEPHDDDGMLSEEISDEQAAAFTAIPGYVLVDDEGKAAAEAEQIAELTAKATALGIAVKANWKAARLAAEIKRVEDKPQ